MSTFDRLLALSALQKSGESAYDDTELRQMIAQLENSITQLEARLTALEAGGGSSIPDGNGVKW